jgi:hypothetical protein
VAIEGGVKPLWNSAFTYDLNITKSEFDDMEELRADSYYKMVVRVFDKDPQEDYHVGTGQLSVDEILKAVKKVRTVHKCVV